MGDIPFVSFQIIAEISRHESVGGTEPIERKELGFPEEEVVE